jgi:hypothetical protein
MFIEIMIIVMMMIDNDDDRWCLWWYLCDFYDGCDCDDQRIR